MEWSIRTAKSDEREYAYTHSTEILQKSGCIGHLRGDMGMLSTQFHTTWDDHCPERKTAAFKQEFDSVVTRLRFVERLLHDRNALDQYCRMHPDAAFEGSVSNEYAFRIDTDQYSYLLRCNPQKGEYNFYLYAYEREMLDDVLRAAKEKITVISVMPREKPNIQEIENYSQAFEAAIGHPVQTIHPFVDAVALVESSDQDLNQPFNRALYDEDGEFMDSVLGPFFIVGYENKQWTSVPADLIGKYMELFRVPEQMVEINGVHHILPVKNETPLYLHSAAYAREHGEIKEYRASLQANYDCKLAIEKAVFSAYNGSSLNASLAVTQMLAMFPVERIRYVLGVTVKNKTYDGRISDANKAWAAGIATAKEQNLSGIVVDRCHSHLLDQFVRCFRETTGMEVVNQKEPTRRMHRNRHEPEL